MWHGAYISWLEEARIEALSQVGVSYGEISAQGYEMPIVSLAINYLRPLKHGDEVTLESWAKAREGIRWPWETKFLKDGDVLVAEAKVDLVFINQKNSQFRLLRKVPNQIEIALQSLQLGPKFFNKGLKR